MITHCNSNTETYKSNRVSAIFVRCFSLARAMEKSVSQFSILLFYRLHLNLTSLSNSSRAPSRVRPIASPATPAWWPRRWRRRRSAKSMRWTLMRTLRMAAVAVAVAREIVPCRICWRARRRRRRPPAMCPTRRVCMCPCLSFSLS